MVGLNKIELAMLRAYDEIAIHITTKRGVFNSLWYEEVKRLVGPSLRCHVNCLQLIPV